MLQQPATYTIEADENAIKKMEDFYCGTIEKSPNENVAFLARGEDFTLTAYKKINKDGLHKVVFQGPKAGYECSIWSNEPMVSKPSQNSALNDSKSHPLIKTKPGLYKWKDQIGSDEVGTGDFFGPVCVCAAYVDNEDLEEIKKLGVTDSKKMDDDYIRKIGPLLIHDFSYSQLSLDNEKYNEVHSKGINMNAIKARMHNRCLLNLEKKFPNAVLCQDQFAEKNVYYSYLKTEKDVARGIFFSTKGELAFPSVALASVIARYSFLRKMDELSKKYGEKIPLGAGAEVDSFAKAFVTKHGLDELKKITKGNFANMKRISGNETLL